MANQMKLRSTTVSSAIQKPKTATPLNLHQVIGHESELPINPPNQIEREEYVQQFLIKSGRHLSSRDTDWFIKQTKQYSYNKINRILILAITLAEFEQLPLRRIHLKTTLNRVLFVKEHEPKPKEGKAFMKYIPVDVKILNGNIRTRYVPEDILNGKVTTRINQNEDQQSSCARHLPSNRRKNRGKGNPFNGDQH